MIFKVWDFSENTEFDTDINYQSGYNVFQSNETAIVTIDVVLGANPNNVSYKTEMLGNYPNPFNPSTTIQFTLKNDDIVKFEIYNLLGQKIRTISDKSYNAGINKVMWHGLDDYNNNVSSGIYFYKMITNQYSSTGKMILMK